MWGYRAFSWVAFALLRWASAFGAKPARSYLSMRRPSSLPVLSASTAALPADARWRWLHCASVGEYEQAVPVIEALKATDSNVPILLTVFSPSVWFTLQEKPPGWLGPQDVILPLPPDRPAALRAWLAATADACGRPRIAWCALVKYEVWPELIHQLNRAGIPVHLFAAHVVDRALPLRWWAGTHRRAWRSLASVKVQDAASVDRLATIGVHATVVGDPRFDRVMAVADTARDFPEIEALRTWVGQRTCVVAGSTWPAEERILAKWWAEHAADTALVIAPHEVTPDHLADLATCWPHAQRFSEGVPSGGSVLVIDGIGWLSRLYAVADIAVVGGGFGKGIHNVLEPAAHGVPIIVGPQTARFREAQELEAAGALVRCFNADGVVQALACWKSDREVRQRAAVAARAYADSGRGAALRIASELES